jgi:hypothetical protein
MPILESKEVKSEEVKSEVKYTIAVYRGVKGKQGMWQPIAGVAANDKIMLN